jgi:hypothetical protein
MENLASHIVRSALRLPSDVNGNPRYYVAQYFLPDLTAKVRLAQSVTRYRGKAYGPGYVFQSYALHSDVQYLLDAMALA